MSFYDNILIIKVLKCIIMPGSHTYIDFTVFYMILLVILLTCKDIFNIKTTVNTENCLVLFHSLSPATT